MGNLILESLQKDLKRDSATPLYQQIENCIETLIREGVIAAKTKLPGDVATSHFLQINQRTLQKALKNLVAKGLLSRSTKTGTFVNEVNIYKESPNIGFYYYRATPSRMAERGEIIQELLSANGYDLKIICYKEEDYFENIDLLEDIKKKRLCAAIIQPVRHKSCFEELNKLEQNKFPYVRFGSPRFINELKAPLVIGNLKQCMNDALGYLWNLGHRKIGLVYGKGIIASEYQNFCEQRKLFDKKRMLDLSFCNSLEHWLELPGDQIVRGYLEENSDVTAVITEVGSSCLNFIRQLEKIGKAVPYDFSIIQLNDIESAMVSHVPVTAYRIPQDEMCETAVSALWKVMNSGYGNKGKDELIYDVNYQLIERKSTSSILTK